MAPSLTDLHTFATLKNLNMLAKVSHSFWCHCHSMEPAVVSNAHVCAVPISQVYSKIDKSTNSHEARHRVIDSQVHDLLLLNTARS
ncbi:hypothetical protein G6F21_011795 [Rhizopus arrhizus]|nr:hypothetical protein G6F21_011795 [Rhizopus arrhizus]KAG1119319.1 hypothetical protein G6F40_001514 [Rhizopus arrhizus]